LSAECRRCIECEGQEHHWLVWLAEVKPGQEPEVPCKHCDAKAPLCERCCDGVVWPLPTEGEPAHCDVCTAELEDEAVGYVL
jgi:hypothetical protein